MNLLIRAHLTPALVAAIAFTRSTRRRTAFDGRPRGSAPGGTGLPRR